MKQVHNLILLKYMKVSNFSFVLVFKKLIFYLLSNCFNHGL